MAISWPFSIDAESSESKKMSENHSLTAIKKVIAQRATSREREDLRIQILKAANNKLHKIDKNPHRLSVKPVVSSGGSDTRGKKHKKFTVFGKVEKKEGRDKRRKNS